MAGLEAAEVRDGRAERAGHLVERAGQTGQLVASLLRELHVQRALLQPPCPLSQLADRQEQGTGGRQSHEAGGHDEQTRDGEQHGAELVQVVKHAAERMEEEEVGAPRDDLPAHHQVGGPGHPGTHESHPRPGDRRLEGGGDRRLRDGLRGLKGPPGLDDDHLEALGPGKRPREAPQVGLTGAGGYEVGGER